jgi:hypothetical protein
VRPTIRNVFFPRHPKLPHCRYFNSEPTAHEKMTGVKNRRIAFYAHLALAAGFVVNAAQSQVQQAKSGQIIGHVVDAVGATIPGASVFVRSNIPPEEKVELRTHTDINGNFKLVLPEGGYDVLVTYPGFAAEVETVAVAAGKEMKVHWKLKALDCSFPGMNCDTFR